jgi:tetratricopeptide (TPR) repeat protein
MVREKELKTIATVLGVCLIGTGGAYFLTQNQILIHEPVELASLDNPAVVQPAVIPGVPAIPQETRTLSGDYLSSIFAQRHHDWKKAGEYLSNVMRQTPDEPSLPKRAMVLSMGAGDIPQALALAQKISANDKDVSPLAELFLAVGDLQTKNYKSAQEHIRKMPPGSLSDFIMPMLNSWVDAANGIYNVEALSTNTIHLHHAVMVTDFLKQKMDTDAALKKVVNGQTLTLEDLERIANIYAHINEHEAALEIYKKVLEQWPDHPSIGKKIQAMEAGQKMDPVMTVKSAEEGVAATLYDMANLLYREYADDSARVFARMALYLKPSLTDGRLLLAAIDARNNRYEEAIASYNMIAPNDEYFLESRRRAADLMDESGATDRALAAFDTLVKEHNDLESLIRIGDIYRRQENFPKAIEVYNEAASRLGGAISKEYWNLLYVRGISYERAGQWDKAEADLKASLVYQPDHPFVLNYLAYAWADQGINLTEALNLLLKAQNLQPEDGYIADSLGWVYYRMDRVDEGLPHLEKAVQLLPYDPVINDHLGDAYWHAGRKREARFQWQRAGNFSKDETLAGQINDKLANGLPAKSVMKEARTQTGDVTAIP